jgi:hypothetical protein
LGIWLRVFFFLPSIRKSRLHDLDHKFKRLVRVKFDLLDPFFLLIFCFSPFNIVFVEDWTLWFCSLSYLWGYYDLLSQVTGLAGRLMLTQFFFFFKWFFEVFLFNVVLVWELRLLVLFNLLSTRFSWSHDQIANMGGWLKWTRVEVFFLFNCLFFLFHSLTINLLGIDLHFVFHFFSRVILFLFIYFLLLNKIMKTF